MITLIDVYEGRKDVERFLYLLMAERLEEGDTNISHVKMPTMEAHQQFLKDRVYRAWYVVATGAGDMVGSVSLTKTNELGIVIRKQHRKHGYARTALKLIMQMHEPLPGLPSVRPSRFVANIRPNNAASIALFESLGATLLQHTFII